MEFILAIPVSVRVVTLFVIGALLGGQINWAVYGLVLPLSSRISPWLAPDVKAPQRKKFDRMPLLGWWGLQREQKVHGTGFWVRPFLIELSCAVGLPCLYLWEIGGGLIPSPPGISPDDTAMLHVQFLLHAVLIGLMMIATFIDFDVKLIPDEITVPGTLIALLLAAASPLSRLPVVELVPLAQPGSISFNLVRYELDHLQVASPAAWPDWFDGPRGLYCGLACLWGWCFALLPKVTTLRYGLIRGVRYFVASITRPPRKQQGTIKVRKRRPFLETAILAGIAVVGSAAVVYTWYQGGGHWQSLLSSLVGLAFGGGLIWAVRIVGSSALGKEAMGFGDVTLMAMIGAFLGWQPALMIFFLAPFTAVFIALLQVIITRRNEIAFGPYLCASTLVLILFWSEIWNGWADQIFSLGKFIPAMVGVCLVLMGIMLFGWQMLKQRMFAD